MPKSRPPYPAAYREQILELARAGQTPEELAEAFGPTAQTIRNWLVQSRRDAGERSDGLTSVEPWRDQESRQAECGPASRSSHPLQDVVGRPPFLHVRGGV